MSNSVLIRRKIKIGPDFSFWTSLNNVADEQRACEYYDNNLPRFEKDASFIESDVIIVFDTNVLLYLYMLPSNQRDGILKYITKNKDRVFIPGQVAFEYLKHRSRYILDAQMSLKGLVSDLENSINEFTSSDKKTLSNKLDSFKQRPVIKNEMPEVIGKLDAWWKVLDESLIKADKDKEDVISELRAKVSDAEQSISSLTKDNVLKTVLCAKNLEPLSSDEKQFLRSLFDELLKQFKEEKNKERFAFPGCGDRKKLDSGFDPCGDFYIYHEIMALMKEMDCDAMFITKDVTKSDWVLPDRRPFMHYLFDEYAHTGHMINIVGLDAIPMDITPIIQKTEDPHEGEMQENVESEGKQMEGTTEENESSEPVRVKAGKEISEEVLMNELAICVDWATNYGGGYVNEEFFLRNILAVRKHYDYDSSKEVLQRLIKKKIIRSCDEEHNGKTIKCLLWGEKY